MPLTGEIKSRLTAAMKARNAVETGVLRVLLGRLQTMEAAQGELNDDQVTKAVQSLIKQNDEEMQSRSGTLTLPDGETKQVEVTGQEDYIARLKAEQEVLKSLLPTYLTEDQIKDILSRPDNLEQLKAAANDGAATGVAMKILKQFGTADGKIVRSVVKGLYS